MASLYACISLLFDVTAESIADIEASDSLGINDPLRARRKFGDTGRPTFDAGVADDADTTCQSPVWPSTEHPLTAYPSLCRSNSWSGPFADYRTATNSTIIR
jgi:hypothetical protein